MTFEELVAQARELSISQRKALINELVDSLTEEVTQVSSVKRVPGLHAGQGWISEDFNEELPESFWLGQDE